MMSIMSEKKPYDPRSAFDDRKQPKISNPLSAKEAQKIDELILPKIKDNLKKLREENPELFRSSVLLKE